MFQNVILLLIILTSIFIISNQSKSKLIKVIQINRHGARTVDVHSKNSLSKLYGKYMKLTGNGFRQHQILGRLARKRYINKLKFLNPDYSPGQFEIFTTQTQRTIYSAEGFINGLYPESIPRLEYQDPELNITKNDLVNYIDELIEDDNPNLIINVISPKNDSLFHSGNCKFEGKYISKMVKDIKNINYFNINEKDINNSIEEIRKFIGVEFNPKDDSDNLKKIIALRKLILPVMYHFDKKWNELSKPAELLMKKLILNKWYKPINENIGKMKRLRITSLFKTILKKLRKASTINNLMKKINEPLFTVFSAHDSNLVDILQNLISYDYLMKQLDNALYNQDIFDILVPPFASNIVIELHKDSKDKYYIKVYYNGKLIKKGFSFNKKSFSEGKIPFDDFSEILEHNIDKKTNEIDCSEPMIKDKTKEEKIFVN